jgi:hypothetical protein
MPGVAAALALLFLNFGLVLAVVALSSTPRRASTSLSAAERCFVCSTADQEARVSGRAVCEGCRTEYFGTGE